MGFLGGTFFLGCDFFLGRQISWRIFLGGFFPRIIFQETFSQYHLNILYQQNQEAAMKTKQQYSDDNVNNDESTDNLLLTNNCDKVRQYYRHVLFLNVRLVSSIY